MQSRYDVVIIGGGKAGLTLARQLLLYSGKTVLLLDKRSDLPGPSQKVGESLVQTSGFYLYKVLDLQEHLAQEHFLKYNLRFHWKTEGLANTSLEEYHNSFIRLGSNIPTFQIDRNLLEEHLLKVNREDPRFEFLGGLRNIKAQLAEDESDHRVMWEGGEVTCRWVVDASGRGSVLKRQFGLEMGNSIRHGSTWCWVEGIVNTERLTGRSTEDIVFDTRRRVLGHMPFFLATNHFCGEGIWFWVIPLHGKTSLGLVYDRAVLDGNEVSSGRKMLDFVCKQWPLFQRDLPNRKILDEGRYFDFSFDCKQTISAQRWALTGEAGRFSDPLYSPGGDLIAIYNTLITDAVNTDSKAALEAKCKGYEMIERVMYESYVNSYSVSYDTLGDQECFSLKYTWELAVYFTFYVLPFINNLFTDQKFMGVHMRKYGLLGPMNRNLQKLLSSFYQWKKKNPRPLAEPFLFDFYNMRPLRESEFLFYEVSLDAMQAEEVLEKHMMRLKEFARYIITHVYASVLGEREALTNAPFINSLKLRETEFDPEKMREHYAMYAGATEVYQWNLNPFALEKFLPACEMEKDMEMKPMGAIA